MSRSGVTAHHATADVLRGERARATMRRMGLFSTRWEAKWNGHELVVARNEFTRGFALHWDGQEVARRAWSFVGLGELHGTAEHEGKPVDVVVLLEWGEGLLTDGSCTIKVNGEAIPDVKHVK